LGLSLLLAITLDDLGVLLSLVGATGSTIVSYILPGFLYYLHFPNEGPVWKRKMAFVQGCLGLVIMPVALAFIFA
jgi:amino acid permease